MASPSLPTRKLGKNGPPVTAMGYGLMGLSYAYGPAKPDPERFEFLDYIYEKGQRNWDSSNSYGDSEVLLGKWFAKNPGKREKILLATKFGLNATTPDGSPNHPDGTKVVGNSPEYIRAAIDKSLERLGTDYVDLWYCHRLNGEVPIEKVVEVMVEQMNKGKCKYLGLSEVSAESLRRACKVHHIDVIQTEYSPFALEIEEMGVLKAARELGVAVIAYSPLGRGFLSGRYKSPDDFEEGDFRKISPKYSKENFGKNLELVHSINHLAKKKGVTSGQLVLAWVLAQGEDIIPIPGTTNKKNYDENMSALDIHLTETEEKEMREAIQKTEIVGVRYPPAMMKYLLADTPPLNA